MFRFSRLRQSRLPSLVRRMGSAGHGHEEVAYLGGRKPGTPWADWEKITFVVYGAAFGMFWYYFSYAQKESFQSWAMREALAREEAEKNGDQVEFGKFYTPVRSFTEEQSKKFMAPSAYQAMMDKLSAATGN